MNRCWPAFVLIFIAFTAQSQFYPINRIKFAPTRTLDIVNPGIEVCYERLYWKKWATQGSIVFLNDLFRITPFSNFEGTRLSFEQKYFYKAHEKTGFYNSVELVFYNSRYQHNAWFNYEHAYEDTLAVYDSYAETYTGTKKMVMVHMKAGFQIIVKSFILEMDMGLGLKFKKIRHFDRLKPEDVMEIHAESPIYYGATAEGDRTTITLPVNFRIGYTF